MAQPKEALVGAQQPIDINSQGKASPHNRTMGNTDTVVFNNNSPTDSATVAFQGAGADVFPDPPPISPGTSSGSLSPQESDVTVNYEVTMGGNTTGPFSIQVGTGPLQIDVISSSGATDLPKAAIPNNGQIQFYDETDYDGTVKFSDALYDGNDNPVTSQPLTANSFSPPLTGKGTNKDIKYTVEMNLQAQQQGVGGGSGTIKIGQN